MRTKLPPFSLEAMTCATLADWLENPPSVTVKESARAVRMRQAISQQDIPLLRLLGSKPALYWRSSLRTAETFKALTEAPKLKLMIGGGIPRQPETPRYTQSLKRLTAQHGTVVHRFGRKSFILEKVNHA